MSSDSNASPTNDHEGSDTEHEAVVSGDHSHESVEELISNYKLVDLKNICRSLNLKVTGNKRPVAERIWNYYHNPQQEEDNQVSTPGTQESYYQQQQQQQQNAQQLQQYQYQQQQQLMQLPQQQQQLVLAFHQQLVMLHQQLSMYHSQGQQVPQNIQQMYMQYVQISNMPMAQQAQVLMQMQQQQLQYQIQQQQYQQMQQATQAHVMNGNTDIANTSSDMKRPREGVDEDASSAPNAKRFKTSNSESSDVMKIINALISERESLTDNSQMIVSVQSLECRKHYVTHVLNAIVYAHMDHIRIVDCIAYVLYEIVDKKVLSGFYSTYMSRPVELYDLRVTVAQYAAQFLKKCADEQGERDYTKSESLVKLFDLMTWVNVLDYVTIDNKESDVEIQSYLNEFALHQKVIINERTQEIFENRNPEAGNYIKNRFEHLSKIVSQDLSELTSEESLNDFVKLLKDAKPYFDASALEIISFSASIACSNRSPWNVFIQAIRNKNHTALNQVLDTENLPMDDDTQGQYEFLKQCNNKSNHWWINSMSPATSEPATDNAAPAPQATNDSNEVHEPAPAQTEETKNIAATSSDDIEQKGGDNNQDQQEEQTAEAPAVKAEDQTKSEDGEPTAEPQPEATTATEPAEAKDENAAPDEQ